MRFEIFLCVRWIWEDLAAGPPAILAINLLFTEQHKPLYKASRTNYFARAIKGGATHVSNLQIEVVFTRRESATAFNQCRCGHCGR